MNKNQKVPDISSKEATILSVLLLRPAEELYGLQIVEASDGLLKRGTVYVILQRMEEKRLIESRQEERTLPEIGIPRRLYAVTGLGMRALDRYEELHTKLARLMAIATARG